MTKLQDRDGYEMVQVKVPVCVTINLTKEDAESMYHRELRQVVDQILVDCEWRNFWFTGMTMDGRAIHCEYEVCPHWDYLPEDECELTMTYDGLFPLDEEDE